MPTAGAPNAAVGGDDHNHRHSHGSRLGSADITNPRTHRQPAGGSRRSHIGGLNFSTQHYHFSNTPRTQLSCFEQQLLESSYRLTRHALTGSSTGSDPMPLMPSTVEVHSSTAPWCPWPPPTPVAEFSDPTAAWNFEFIRRIFERSQIPMEAKACRAFAAEFAIQYALTHPAAVADRSKPARLMVRDDSNSHAKKAIADCLLVPLCAIDDVSAVAQCIKTMHALWLGAVHAQLRQMGSNRSDGVSSAPRALVVDDVYEALLDVAGDQEARNTVTTEVYPHEDALHRQPQQHVSIKRIVAALAEHQLVDMPATDGEDDTNGVAEESSDEEDAVAALHKRRPVKRLTLASAARQFVTSDVFTTSKALPPSGSKGDTMMMDDAVLEGCECLAWATGPLTPPPPPSTSLVGISDTDRVDFYGMLHPSAGLKYDDHFTQPLGAVKQRDSATVSPQQASLQANTSFRLPTPESSVLPPPASLRPDTSLFSSPHDGLTLGQLPRTATPGDRSLSLIMSSASPPFHAVPISSHPGLPPLPALRAAAAPHVLLRDIDVPRCPKTLWLPDDVDSTTDDGSRVHSPILTARRSRSTQHHLGHHHNHNSGQLTSRLSVRSHSSAELPPALHPSGTGAALSTPPRAAARAPPHPVPSGSPLSYVKQQHQSQPQLRPSSRSVTLRGGGRSSAQMSRPTSVAQHYALQQPEYVRFKETLRSMRVTQFR